MGLEAVSAEPDRQRVARRDAARVDAAAHLDAREAHAVAAPAVVLVGEAQQGEQALQKEGGGRAAADAYAEVREGGGGVERDDINDHGGGTAAAAREVGPGGGGGAGG